jgi:DNA-directed RNA polymerase specialized sigma24 family protein
VAGVAWWHAADVRVTMRAPRNVSIWSSNDSLLAFTKTRVPAYCSRMPGDGADREMAAQFQRIIRRVKQSMNYRGSYSTHDILASLVTRWVQSGEWERLKQLPSEDRKIGESVRRFILDRLGQLRRRGVREELDDVVLPDEVQLREMVELAELRGWIEERIAELERGDLDARVKIPLASPKDVGRALRLQLQGKTQRQIATEVGLSLGAVNKRIAEGTNYLVVLQGIEAGLAT